MRHTTAVDVFASDAEADDAAGEQVDYHEDPMAAKQNRLATKQVHAPEAVLGLREEGEPGGTRGTRMIWAVVRREDPAHDVLINLHAECMRDLLGNALIAESGVTKLHLEDGRDDFLCRDPSGRACVGFPRTRTGGDILRSTSALWNRNNVAGLRTAASFATRRGRTNSTINPSTNRSIVVRGGARRRERPLMISCVLKQQRFGDDGADTAGARELGQSDDQLHREKKQVTHRQGRLPGTPFSTRLLVYGGSRYDLRIRTPQVVTSAHARRESTRAAKTQAIAAPRTLVRRPFGSRI